jgi:hypothetical protein
MDLRPLVEVLDLKDFLEVMLKVGRVVLHSHHFHKVVVVVAEAVPAVPEELD